MATDPRVAHLVRAGEIRLALFLPQYAKDSTTGELRGVGMGFVGIEFVRKLAERLGVKLVVTAHPTPPAAIASLEAGESHVAFFGIDHAQDGAIALSEPIVQFDYSFLLPPTSRIHSLAEADRAGVRIAVMSNHASTKALTRIVKRAELVGSDLPDAAFDLLRTGRADAFAAPRAQLLDYSNTFPGSRVLPESYGTNRVAMAVAKRETGLLAYLGEFIAEAKASGLIARIIESGGLRGFSVAPRA